MRENKVPITPTRNPITETKHRREVLLQITLPFVIGLVILLALAVFVSVAGGSNTSRWADVSIIWLIIPSMFLGLLLMVLLGALLYLLITLIRALPVFTLKIQEFLSLVYLRTKRASDLAVEPIFKIEGLLAAIRYLTGKRVP